MPISGRPHLPIPRFRELWDSRLSRCEKIAVIILSLVSAVTILSTAVVQTLVVALALTVLTCRLLRHPLAFRRTPLDIPYALFILGRVVSVAFSQDPARSLSALHIEFFFYVVFFLATQTVDRNEVGGSLALTFTLTIAGVIAAVIGIMKVLFHLTLVASSTTAGTYTLGAYLCAILPFALLAGNEVRSRVGEIVHFLTIGVICLGITLTLDRVHWAAMVLILGIVGVLFERRVLWLSLVGAVVVAAVFPSVWLRLGTLFHLHDAMEGRDTIWRGALMLIGEHPFVGFGPRTFLSVFPLFDQMTVRGVSSWHNDYLQVYMESGLLGLLPLAWLVWAVIKESRRSLKDPYLPANTRRLIQALTLSLTTVFFISGMLENLVGITFRIVLALFALLVSRRVRSDLE